MPMVTVAHPIALLPWRRRSPADTFPSAFCHQSPVSDLSSLLRLLRRPHRPSHGLGLGRTVLLQVAALDAGRRLQLS
jgi:hypothetical protein